MLGVSFLATSFVIADSSGQTQAVFEYDGLGRLVAVCHGANGQLDRYQFDPADNRTTVSATGSACAPPAASSFSIATPATVSEGASLVFQVSRTGGTTSAQAVSYATANGTAVSGSDYTAGSAVLNFDIGETSKPLTVTTINDAIYELNETVRVNLSSPTNGATISNAQATGTINDNDSAPSFAVADSAAIAGSSLSFTVTKTGSTSLPHAVTFSTANGTASAGVHYTAASGTLDFAAGESSKVVSVATTAGSVASGSKTMVVNLSSSTNGSVISDAQGVGTINNVSPPPSFSVNDMSAEEGQDLVFTITRSGDTSGANSVNYATANGTATAPSDYGAVNGTHTFTAGQTSKSVSISLPIGANGESTEYMYLNLSSPTGGASVSDSQGVGEIYNYFEEPNCNPACSLPGGGDEPTL